MARRATSDSDTQLLNLIRREIAAALAAFTAGGGGGGGITTLTGAPGTIVDSQVNAAAAIAWSKISKAGSTLADLATRSAGDLSSGTLPLARISSLTDAQIDAAAAIAWSKISKVASSLADLATRSAADLSSGTLPLARLSGITNTEIDAAAAIAWSKLDKTGSSLADLTTRSAAALSSGIIPDARVPGFTSDGVSRITQLAFLAAQSASADANTLDDYEEGNWTAAFNGTTSQSGQVYSRQTCRYIKIGKFVWIGGRLTLSTLGTITGNVRISGVPFASANQVGGNVSYWSGLNTGAVFIGLILSAGAVVLDVYRAGAAQTSLSNMVQADMTATADLIFNAQYEASA
jgi:hypothetical protein